MSDSASRPRPSLLYKHVSVQKALYILITGKIYFAACSEFNDPFDGKYPSEDLSDAWIDEYARQRAKTEGNFLKIREILRQESDQLNIGVFCMSDDWRSPPMWAHYADMHKGCCLEFRNSKSFPFVFTGEVEYPERAPTFPDAKFILPHEAGSVYMTKSERWSCESEWRAIMYDSNAASPLRALPEFDNILNKHPRMRGSGAYRLGRHTLKSVTLGYKMEDSDIEAIYDAAGNKVDVYIAEPAKSPYKMERNILLLT